MAFMEDLHWKGNVKITGVTRAQLETHTHTHTRHGLNTASQWCCESSRQEERIKDVKGVVDIS